MCPGPLGKKVVQCKKQSLKDLLSDLLSKLYSGDIEMRRVYKKISDEFFVRENKKFIVKMFTRTESGKIYKLAYPEIEFFETSENDYDMLLTSLSFVVINVLMDEISRKV